MTLLQDGSVLVAGGSAEVRFADVYRPQTGTWRPTGGMTVERYAHTATILRDGRALVTGGHPMEFDGTHNWSKASAELYDPMTNSWTPAASMAQARAYHTATLMPDGQILVVGGIHCKCSPYTLASAEVYNPTTNTWRLVGRMGVPRAGHTATLLNDGRVLVAGGATSDFDKPVPDELYNPRTNSWSSTGSMRYARAGHTATLLPGGNVLVVSSGGNPPVPQSAELYNPRTGSWRDAGSMQSSREDHTATLLRDGRVLVAGGSSAELYDVPL